MKKAIACFIAIIISIMGFSLVGCSNNQPSNTETEYEIVKLTKTNYSDYIAINTDYSDYNLIALSESSCLGNIFIQRPS